VVDPQAPQAPAFLTLDAHAAEAWCCAWLDSDVFASGADDCTLKLWDRRSPGAAVCSVRSHSAGVTFVGPAPGAEANGSPLFISGGYDG
jgi:WD40 repeat protein